MLKKSIRSTSFILLLVLFLQLTNSIPVLASNNMENQEDIYLDKFYNEDIYSFDELENMQNTVIINEYDTLMNAKKEIQKNRNLFNQEEIDEIKDIDPIDHILDLNNLSDKELQLEGYSEENIQNIRGIANNTITPTPEILRSVSAKLAVYLDPSRLTRNNGRTTGYVIANWAWSNKPFYTGATDTIAWGWGKNMTRDSFNTRIFYRNTVNDEREYVIRTITDYSPNSGCATNFPLIKSFGEYYVHFAERGRSYIELTNYDSYVDGLEVNFVYAHPRINISGISVSWTGASINIDGSADEMKKSTTLFH